MSKIGFIGLGLMGSAMVGRLQDQGHTLCVLGNRDRTELDRAVARGAVEVTSAKDLAANCDVVMLCVGTSDQVEARMLGADGVLAGLRPDAVVIDFGTSLPASTKAMSTEVAEAGGQYLDAPLGRTPSHAKDGMLNIMCSGDKPAFDRVEPILQDLGENVFHLGEIGTGHTIKLINNFFGMTVANAMAEALAMADVMGVDRKQLYDVMASGPLHSGMMDFVSAYGLEQDASKLQFAVKNAAKDVGYYRQMAGDAGAESIMSRSTYDALRAAQDAGKGDAMVSEMVDFYASKLST